MLLLLRQPVRELARAQGQALALALAALALAALALAVLALAALALVALALAALALALAALALVALAPAVAAIATPQYHTVLNKLNMQITMQVADSTKTAQTPEILLATRQARI